MKKYSLQRKVYQSKDKRAYIWKDSGTHSDDLMALKRLCPSGFRIVDNESKMVVHEP